MDQDKHYIRIHKTALVVVVLVLIAGFIGWKLGHGGQQPTTTVPITASGTLPDKNMGDVAALVTYQLPDGWKQASCPGSGSVYVVPKSDATIDCNAVSVSPITLSVDAGNHTDCNQLQNVTEVKKHICVSVFINGHKSLKASTEYLASSSYKQPTTINAYYVDTGRGVVKVAYQYTSDNQYQSAFDQLANSIKAT